MIQFTQPIKDILDNYETNYLEFNGRELKRSGNRLDVLRRWFGDRSTLIPMDVERFFQALKDKAPATRNRYRTLLKHIISWSIDHELATGELARSLLKVEAEHNERTRRISKDEEARLLRFMTRDVHDLFLAALDTGLRKGALLKLKFKDVNDGVLLVPAKIQKQKQSQIIPLTKRVQAIIHRRYTVEKDAREFIFSGKDWRNQWNKARRLAKVEDLHWHDIRGEFASRLSEKGVEVPVVSKLLGHGSLNTTQRYLRPRVEQFRDAIAKLEEV